MCLVVFGEKGLVYTYISRYQVLVSKQLEPKNGITHGLRTLEPNSLECSLKIVSNIIPVLYHATKIGKYLSTQ